MLEKEQSQSRLDWLLIMNISKLIQALNKAKKLRRALPFHHQKIHGLDIPDEEYPKVLPIIKAIFKSLKSHGFDIRISYWGEIMVIEPYRKINVILSIGYFEDETKLAVIRKELATKNYLEVTHNQLVFNRLQLKFRGARAGTKWRVFYLDEVKVLDEFALSIARQIIDKTASLTTNSRFNFFQSFNKVTIEDVMAMARYGAALYGRNTALYFLVRDKNISFYPDSVIIESHQIQLFSFNKESYPYALNKKALSLLTLLPIELIDNKVKIERR